MASAYITRELTVDDIEAYLNHGNISTQDVDAVPTSKTNGRGFLSNPNQKIIRLHNGPARVGSAKQEREYAVQAQLEEERNLLEYGRSGGFVEAQEVESMAGTLDQLELESNIGAVAGLEPFLIPENATDVYNNYDFQPRKGSNLPINHFRDEVVDTIESNQVTVIQGSTGSGKTTQVPQYILNHYATQNRYCNIIVTQPRRIAAISIAQRVCNERGWELGTVCGYQIGMDVRSSEDTRILYCTTGILREKFIKTKNMHPYTHVILDEIHERDQETDFALLIVRKLLRSTSPNVKVVLMSATMDSQKFANYFSVPVRGRMEPAPVVAVEGRTFSVREFFLDDLTMLGHVEESDPSKPEISSQTEDIAVRLIEELDQLERKEQGVDRPVRGTILVFLPGLVEITSIFDKLRAIETSHNLKIIPLHSTITIEEQYRAFELPEKGFRKVILSTNIAESSITVPDIKYVIDFCLTKNLVCDMETNYTRLQTDWASRANCLQRKGRAGRVSNGRAYLMVTRQFYENYLQDYGIPEMQRCPLNNLVLKTKLLDMGSPKQVLGLALDPPNLADIERTILSLKEVFALSTTPGSLQRHDGDLTFVGRVMADLPIDVHMAKLILLGHVFGLLEECLIIAAALSLKSIFAKPFSQRLEAHRHKLSWAEGSLSDCFAVLKAYRVWRTKKRTTDEFRRAGYGERQWCKMNFIQMRRINEVEELVRELQSRLVKFNIQVPAHNPHASTESVELPLLLKLVIAGAFYPNYFQCAKTEESFAVKQMSGLDPLNTIMFGNLPMKKGILYKDQLKRLLAPVHSNPKIMFEETKAFVQFTGSEHRVHPCIYLALKLRTLTKPLEIMVYKEGDACILMDMVNQALEKVSAPKRLRTNRLIASDGVKHMSSSGQTFTRVEVPLLSVTSRPTIVVTEVVNCGHFFGQFVEVDLNTLQPMQPDLYSVQNFLNSKPETLEPLQSRPHVGLVCVAPYYEESVGYYRARVDAVEMRKVGPQQINMAKVYFVDYGNSEWVPFNQLKTLPPACPQLPFQAVEFCLCGIRPSAAESVDGKWGANANKEFKREVCYKVFSIEVYSQLDDVVRIRKMQLFSRLPGPCMEDHLIKNHLADPAEESFLSQQEHRRWTELEGKPEDVEDGREVNVDEILRSAKTRPTQTVRLRGPTNPLVMGFEAMSFVGRRRGARVDPESVNSIAIDDEPQNPCKRLLCAGFVGLNQEASHVVLRDTTLLPLIPGLPALVALLFAPIAELRTNPERTQYIGALCGLGFDPASGQSILQDNDMEVLFDAEITSQDLLKINCVRMAINIAIGGNNQSCQWNADCMPTIQERAREHLLQLVRCRRKHISPEPYSWPLQWNQVPQEFVVPHGLQGTEVDHQEAHLLNLHNAILLEEESAPLSLRERMQSHLKELETIAKSGSYEPVMCEACGIQCLNSFMLGFHINTNKHLKMVDKYNA